MLLNFHYQKYTLQFQLQNKTRNRKTNNKQGALRFLLRSLKSRKQYR